MSEIYLNTSSDKVVASAKKKINKIGKKTSENLLIKCEWSDCYLEMKCKYKFYEHCSKHVSLLVNMHLETDIEVTYKCDWGECHFSSCDAYEFTRHVKYHGYLTGLKTLGAYVIQETNLPPCMMSEDVSNSFPSDVRYVCQWELCGNNSSGIQEHIDHVCYHIKYLTSVDLYRCKWKECESSFQKKSKLVEHMRTHTKEKFIACPNCGYSFSNKTKFSDHCQRQKPFEEHKFQCDHCHTLHPTERMLKEHMRQHINHYQCPFCEMTCIRPAALCRHIRYKHLESRPFKCSTCEYRCKSKSDLQTHCCSRNKFLLECYDTNCKFTSHSQSAMSLHYEMIHVYGKKGPVFACHLCEKKCSRGAYLTKHLSSAHNLKKPPGFSRFQYILEDDGFYRLQTVRLESLDVSEISGINMQQSGSEEDVDDPSQKMDMDSSEKISAQSVQIQSEKTVTIDVLSDKGQIISSCTVLADDSMAAPSDAEVIAVGS